MDLWTTQRGVAHKLHKANNSSKQKRTIDVLPKPDKSKCYRHGVCLFYSKARCCCLAAAADTGVAVEVIGDRTLSPSGVCSTGFGGSVSRLTLIASICAQGGAIRHVRLRVE